MIHWWFIDDLLIIYWWFIDYLAMISDNIWWFSIIFDEFGFIMMGAVIINQKSSKIIENHQILSEIIIKSSINPYWIIIESLNHHPPLQPLLCINCWRKLNLFRSTAYFVVFPNISPLHKLHYVYFKMGTYINS